MASDLQLRASVVDRGALVMTGSNSTLMARRPWVDCAPSVVQPGEGSQQIPVRRRSQYPQARLSLDERRRGGQATLHGDEGITAPIERVLQQPTVRNAPPPAAHNGRRPFPSRTRPRTGPATASRRGKRAPPPAPSRTTFSARQRPKPGSDSQGKSGLRKITRDLSSDLATFGWTGQPPRRSPPPRQWSWRYGPSATGHIGSPALVHAVLCQGT
jgi:hypothetical protein